MKEVSEQLKPCPFDNGRAWVRWSLGDPGEPTPYFARCDTCAGEGPVRYTEAEAIAAWNRRASAWMPPESDVSLAAQVEIVRHAANYMAGLWSGPAHVKNLSAALNTLQSVQRQFQPLPEPPKEGE